jgi:hypothetical protein
MYICTIELFASKVISRKEKEKKCPLLARSSEQSETTPTSPVYLYTLINDTYKLIQIYIKLIHYRSPLEHIHCAIIFQIKKNPQCDIIRS